MVEVLDRNLKNYGDIIKETTGRDVADAAGAEPPAAWERALWPFLTLRWCRGFKWCWKLWVSVIG